MRKTERLNEFDVLFSSQKSVWNFCTKVAGNVLQDYIANAEYME